MPAPQSNDIGRDQAGDSRNWKSQLERGRLSALTTPDGLKNSEGGKPLAAAEPDGQPTDGGALQWQGELEHQRLAALAMGPAADFPGPGAATGGMNPVDTIKKLPAMTIKAKKIGKILSDRQTMWGINNNYEIHFGLLSLLMLPAIFGHKLKFDGQLKATAAELNEFMRSSGLTKIPNPYVKLVDRALKHFTVIMTVEWLALMASFVLVFGTLFLIAVLAIMIVHCGQPGNWLECGLKLIS